jgi:hypothetical protein
VEAYEVTARAYAAVALAGHARGWLRLGDCYLKGDRMSGCGGTRP